MPPAHKRDWRRPLLIVAVLAIVAVIAFVAGNRRASARDTLVPASSPTDPTAVPSSAPDLGAGAPARAPAVAAAPGNAVVATAPGGAERAGEAGAVPASDERPPPPDVYGLSSAELLDLAKRCEVRWDRPPVLDGDAERLGADVATALGLTDRERAEVDEAFAAYNQRMLDQLRALYTEATGSAEVDGLSPQALLSEILDKSADGEASRIFQRLSAERAGLARPPADPAATSALERVYRLETGAGDAFEKELAGRIGPDKARALREHNDGFGAKSTGKFGCPR
jgi:hypothetical protein